MRKRYINSSEMLKTSLSTGRAAGIGILYDDYSDESGNPKTIRGRGRVRLPNDGINPEELSGPVIIVRKGKEKEDT